jgi:hypothetical protein
MKTIQANDEESAITADADCKCGAKLGENGKCQKCDAREADGTDGNKPTSETMVDHPIGASAANIIHCRDSGVAIAKSTKWTADVPAEFQWMPGGVTTITASFNGKPIELTVECDEQAAQSVQASFDGWRQERPKQKVYGCVEHREEEAALWPEKFERRSRAGRFLHGDTLRAGRSQRQRAHSSLVESIVHHGRGLRISYGTEWRDGVPGGSTRREG